METVVIIFIAFAYINTSLKYVWMAFGF